MNPYVKLLYAALEAPLGIVVTHENPQSARSQFYAARRKHNDPALARISVTILEDRPNQLFLIHTMEDPSPCPDEKLLPSPEPMSGSSLTTSNGLKTPTEEPSALQKLYALSSEPSDKK